MVPLQCPRCGREVLPPSLTRHSYRCPEHGDVPALGPATPGEPDVLADVSDRSDVPVWFPHPMPDRWLCSGVRSAHTPKRRVVAVAMGFSGRGLAAGPTDVVVVAEAPGSGLGARYAGLSQPDPGADILAAPALVKIHTGHRSTGLWPVPTDSGRVAYCGEADGQWLWIIGWPDTAWSLVEDDLRLADAREHAAFRNLTCGAINPRLSLP